MASRGRGVMDTRALEGMSSETWLKLDMAMRLDHTQAR